MELANFYPAGMRVRADVAVALMDAGRDQEAVQTIVHLYDPLLPDGSAPLNRDGSPSESVVRGDQVKTKLAHGFRDPDSITHTVRFNMAAYDRVVEATDTIEKDGEVIRLVDLPEPSPVSSKRKKKTADA
ncbi:MAG: hypothetical protein AB7V46_25730 [Thermomicrobiales bacterium]